VSTLLQPLGHLLPDLRVGNRVTGVGLLNSPVDLRQKHQPFYRVLNRRVIWQIVDGLKNLLLRRHDIQTTTANPCYQLRWTPTASKRKTGAEAADRYFPSVAPATSMYAGTTSPFAER